MSRRTKGIALLAVVAAILLLGAGSALLWPSLEVRVERPVVPADGAAQTRVTVRRRGLATLSPLRLRLLTDGETPQAVPPVNETSSCQPRLLSLRQRSREVTEATLRAGCEAGAVAVEARAWGARATAPVRFQSLVQDSFGDGLPDAMRLEDAADRERFRRWFALLAEMQYYHASADADREVDDCAALIRYAFHEALRRHDGEWRRRFASPVEVPFEDVEKYAYPRTPLGAALFRTRPGPLVRADFHDGTFREFADAGTLVRYNSYALGRQADAARAGDLLVFYQPHQKQPYHTMIFLGASQLLADEGADWVVYHTGESNGAAGVIKKVPLSVLRAHPAARWRPVPENPNFLGYYRFNILR